MESGCRASNPTHPPPRDIFMACRLNSRTLALFYYLKIIMNWCVEWFELFVQLVKVTRWLARGTIYYLKKLIDWLIDYLFFFERRDGFSLYEFFKDLPGYSLRVAAYLVLFYRLVDPLYNFGFFYVLSMKAMVIFLIFSKVSNEKGDLHKWLATFKLVVFCIFFYYNEDFFLDDSLFGVLALIVLLHFTLS